MSFIYYIIIIYLYINVYIYYIIYYIMLYYIVIILYIVLTNSVSGTQYLRYQKNMEAGSGFRVLNVLTQVQRKADRWKLDPYGRN